MKKFCIALIVMALVPTAMVQAGGKGFVTYDVWLNMPDPGAGQGFFDPLFNNPDYPFNPDQSYELKSYIGLRDWADNYVARLYGYVIIPKTGIYNFYTASSDQSQVFLSTEGWPDTIKKIAWIDTYNATSGPPDWAEFATQKSEAFSLQQGQVIYLEALQRDGADTGTGTDHLYVGWQGPGQVLDSIAGPISTVHPRAAKDPAPADGATLVAVDTQLTWTAPIDVNDVATYKVFTGNEPNLAGMTLLADVGTATTANPGTLQKGQTLYWRVETTHSNGGNPFTVRGNIWQFTTIPPTAVIKTQPQNLFILIGTPAVFSVVAESDTDMTFKWFKVGSPDTEVGTGDTLTIPDAQVVNEGQYYCAITNSGGTVNSYTATLRLKRMIAYWPLDTDLADATGNLKSGQYFSTDSSAPVFEPGVKGNAIAINLADRANAQYCKLADASVPALSATGITGNVTRSIACWAKNSLPVGQIENWCTIFGFTSPTATDLQSFDFDRQGDISQYCIHRYGAEWSMHPIDGEWHFLAATFENGTVRWYIDGIYGGQAATDLQTVDMVHLGKRGHSTPVWQGWVDDARIYNYALNPYEVAQLYIDVVPTAVICPEYKAGDINRDCKVNMEDFAEMARIWMECGRIPASECDL